MLTNAQIKHIKLLADKKYRTEAGLFVVEGEKLVEEALQSTFHVPQIYVLEDVADSFAKKISGATELYPLKPFQFARLSAMHTPPTVLAVIEMPAEEVVPSAPIKLVLDRIQDPGNMGTLLRIADWFGIEEIIYSPESVNPFNPKVVQASMGSIFRVRMIESDLHSHIRQSKLPLYAATLSGRPIQEMSPIREGELLFGNESSGIHPSLLSLATEEISILRKGNAESLNVAVAAGIICHHLLS